MNSLSAKVCHITTVHHPFDDRIFYKECLSLKNSGYDVSLVTTHDKNETVSGISIVSIPEQKNRFCRILINSANALVKSLKTKSLIFHFHDPELLPAGLILKILGKKVIYDVHEDVSKQMPYKDWIKIKILRYILSYIFYYFEQFCAFCYDVVVTVTPDIQKKFPQSMSLIFFNIII